MRRGKHKLPTSKQRPCDYLRRRYKGLRADMELRRAVLDTVVLMLEDSLRNTTLSVERRESYTEIQNRVRDMQRSLFSAPYEVQFLESRRRAMESRSPTSTNAQQPS